MKRIIALFCAILLVLPLTTQASAAENTTITPNDNLYRVTELDELRTTNSETFILSDGSCEAVVYAYDKYYQDEDGKLCLIDNSIIATSSVLKPTVNASSVSEYKYKNASNDMDVYFKEFTPDVMVSTTNSTLSFSPINVNKTTAQVGGSRDYPQISDYLLAGANYISYPEIYNKTDFVYAVDNGLVKEYIILKDKTALQRFAFSVNSKGYEVKNNNGQTIDFVDGSGNVAFSFGKLFAIDSSNSYTDDLSYSVISDGSNTTVTFALNNTWASSNERTFPILIDPSVMVSGSNNTYDAYVCSKYPSTNYQMNNYLRTGKDEDFYVRKSYIRFDLPYNIDGDNVTSAYINLKMYSGVTPTVKAYRVTESWNPSSITWNNQPRFTTVDASYNATLISDNWYRATVTNVVKSWLKGVTSNNGFLIQDNTENNTTHWTTFYSSDAASPNKPELVINYSSTKPLKTYDIHLYKNSAMTTSTDTLNNYITSASNIFTSKYRVSFNKVWAGSSTSLNQRSGCTKTISQICNSDCGTLSTCGSSHHKSANHFLYVHQSSSNKIVRYVDYALCFLDSSNDHIKINGAAVSNKDIIITLQSSNVQRTTCHEFSHWLGARDNVCVSGQPCVMNPSSNVYNVWCTQCAKDIVKFMDT